MKKVYETKFGPVEVKLVVNSTAEVIGTEIEPVETLLIDGIEVCADVRDTLTFKHESLWTPGSGEDNVAPEQWSQLMEELNRVKKLAIEDKKFNLDAQNEQLDYAIDCIKTTIEREQVRLEDLQKMKVAAMTGYAALEGVNDKSD